MVRPFLVHTARLEAAFETLDARNAFAFGAACAERQWPVYLRASEGKSWGRQSILRETLDVIWDWLAGAAGRPEGYAERCEEAIPEEVEDDAAGAAREVAGSFFSLASAIENDDLGDCLQVAFNGLNIVEAFVYEHLGLPISAENDEFVDDNELLQAEIKRQDDDLALVRRGGLSPSVVEELRERSKGRSILGDYWY